MWYKICFMMGGCWTLYLFSSVFSEYLIMPIDRQFYVKVIFYCILYSTQKLKIYPGYIYTKLSWLYPSLLIIICTVFISDFSVAQFLFPFFSCKLVWKVCARYYDFYRFAWIFYIHINQAFISKINAWLSNQGII